MGGSSKTGGKGSRGRSPTAAAAARHPSRIGLALAGGGPEGAVYEIGALRALDEALDGVKLNALDFYVGLSAGAFVASCLANRFSTLQLTRAITQAKLGQHPFHPDTFLTPDYREFFRRATMLPRLLVESIADYLKKPGDLTLAEALTRMSRGLPVGIFDSRPMEEFLAKIFAQAGRTNDFRRLERQLVVVAADLDSGKAVRFGTPGFDDVPISKAVQASTSLPGVYTPVEIDGRNYVDGVLLKTLHASAALEAGADLLLCVNPIVPVDTAQAVERGVMRRGKLVDRGLPTVLSQSLRTLIRSRLAAGMRAYDSRFGNADVVLLEPRRDDYRMFFTNVFSFSERRAVCEHAYRRTREDLLARREELEPILERHGLELNIDVLEDPQRHVWGRIADRKAATAIKEKKAASADPASVTRRLDEALGRLEAMLAEG